MPAANFTVKGPYISDDQIVFVPEDTVGRMMQVSDEKGNLLGVYFKADGTFAVGSWDEDGEWHELTLVDTQVSPYPTDWSVFDLGAYHDVLLAEGERTPERKQPDK